MHMQAPILVTGQNNKEKEKLKGSGGLFSSVVAELFTDCVMARALIGTLDVRLKPS